MKLLLDAQLPRKLALRLRSSGYDVVHTLELPAGNQTSDESINELSVRERMIVATKDSDFVNSFLLSGRPYKLLLVSTGNIKNAELEELFSRNIKTLMDAFEQFDFIEIGRTQIIYHK